eukprot:superscaffoldBa00000796_g7293
MIFLQKFLNVFVTLSLLSSPASTMERAPQLTLWGKVVDFTFGCSHLRLKRHISIPTLQELTVCLNLKFKALASTPWTAFMYRHPEVQNPELGLEGKGGRLVVWLFGTKWTTPPIILGLKQWHSLCLTWSHTKDRPALYINRKLVDITAAHDPSVFPSCRKLAPNGTLTLGTAHHLVNGNIQIKPFTRMLGKLSLFRLWGRERSEQEVTSLHCTEGELVKWERDHWDGQFCTPLPDSTLQCEWSIYEVRLMLAIICENGSNIKPYIAREIAHHWLREVLPDHMYLPRVSVFEVSRFDCLAHVNVIPSLDVSAVQNRMHTDLKTPYRDPRSQLLLLAGSIHATPLVLYFEVKVNVSITGDCEAEQILSTWLNTSLPDDMIVLDLQMIPKVGRESCVFQVQVMMSLSDTQEMEEQMRYLLLIPYNEGSISIATEDIQISRILILQCNAETHQTRKGLFEWPATSGGQNATRPCPKNPRRYATRHWYPFNSTVAFISLPSVLQHSFPQSSPRVQFQFYGIPMLFKSSQQGQILNTFVVSASVTNATSPVKDLDEDIKVTLHHLIPNDDVSRTKVDLAHEQILTIITYVGCGISSLFLGITVLTYTAFEKLRRDYPSQILLNLSLALLGLNLVFLVNSWLASWGLYGLCVAVAFTLHYFVLASFTWMGLEAVNMYFALVKVFNVYVPSYILKFCVLGWGIPLVICVLVFLVNRDAYGSHLYTDKSLDNSDDLVEQLSISRSRGQTQVKSSKSISTIGPLSQVQLHRQHVSFLRLQPERLIL